jgi:hypothetical protein
MCSKNHVFFLRVGFIILMLATLACNRKTSPSNLSSGINETPTPSSLTLTTSSTTINVNQTNQFTANGGVPPYVYSVVSGGGIINSQTGSYSAPSQAASVVVRVTDTEEAVAELTIAVVTGTNSSGLTLIPSSNSVAVNGTISFSASGGTPAYSFAIISGGGTIGSTSGIFTAPSSTGPVEVQVTDSLGAKASSTISVTSTTEITGEITLPSGLIFNIPQKPAVSRCGSVISLKINQAFCSVNYITGASQNLGLVMQMVKFGGSGACPSVCMCTGENLNMSGWTCAQLPEGKTFQPEIRGCGSRIKIFRAGTADQSTCVVNHKGPMQAFRATMGMTLLSGKQTVCDKAKCTCTDTINYNYTNAGWACSLE